MQAESFFLREFQFIGQLFLYFYGSYSYKTKLDI